MSKNKSIHRLKMRKERSVKRQSATPTPEFRKTDTLSAFAFHKSLSVKKEEDFIEYTNKTFSFLEIPLLRNEVCEVVRAPLKTRIIHIISIARANLRSRKRGGMLHCQDFYFPYPRLENMNRNTQYGYSTTRIYTFRIFYTLTYLLLPFL